jgi:hypothetical protein
MTSQALFIKLQKNKTVSGNSKRDISFYRLRQKFVLEYAELSSQKLRVKGKAVLLQARSGPDGSRNGGKVVSLTHWPPLPPGNAPGTHFC